jgi:hypothetical protein
VLTVLSSKFSVSSRGAGQGRQRTSKGNEPPSTRCKSVAPHSCSSSEALQTPACRPINAGMRCAQTTPHRHTLRFFSPTASCHGGAPDETVRMALPSANSFVVQTISSFFSNAFESGAPFEVCLLFTHLRWLPAGPRLTGRPLVASLSRRTRDEPEAPAFESAHTNFESGVPFEACLLFSPLRSLPAGPRLTGRPLAASLPRRSRAELETPAFEPAAKPITNLINKER